MITKYSLYQISYSLSLSIQIRFYIVGTRIAFETATVTLPYFIFAFAGRFVALCKYVSRFTVHMDTADGRNYYSFT
ncbi:hypothetical protein BpHYR1_022435 [Brachionus plicatilis]|uniref:Uncharacterized protein n=1 Tax=Brachionus plicatilis TaxID=10195 RepID=A0A3M7REB4_BRAPC|nr:hypothetical protein BpHYR1_022435 [Brachionus plicatilis]